MNDQKSEDELIKDVPLADSKVLAAHVVVYRVLGMNKNLAKACMEELAIRRKNGADFAYEDFIEKNVSSMPKMNNTNFNKITKNIQEQVRNVGGAFKTNSKKNSS